MLLKNNKCYIALVEKAEKAYLNKQYLEAFLIQSCLIESVVKEYAKVKLKPFDKLSKVFHGKLNGQMKLAQLLDMLFMASKITSRLYENLSQYKQRRNKIIHNILKYGIDDVKLIAIIKKAYDSGKQMKGFIVDDMIYLKNGETIASLAAEQEAFLSGHLIKFNEAFDREYEPAIKELENEISKIIKKDK